MKFFIALLLTALLSFALCLFLPSWTVAVAAFIVSVIIVQHPGKAFLAGFLALLLLWGGLAWWISAGNDHVLSHRIGLLIFKSANPYLPIIASAVIGALLGGFGALTGSFLRRPAQR